MSDKIEKATYPTSQYTASCDTFDSHLKVGLHETEDTKEVKVLVDLNGEEVSLYQEDVAMLIANLTHLQEFAVERTSRLKLLK